MKHCIAFILVLVQQSEARLDPYDGITFTDVILNRNFISCKYVDIVVGDAGD